MLSITISMTDFKTVVREAVRIEMEILQRKLNKKTDCEILSRKETAILLRIDLSTLWQWTEDGKISSYKIGRRVYYKRSEIEYRLNQSN